MKSTRLKFFPILLFLLITTQIVSAGFSDVSSSHLNFDAIEYVQAEGIVGGYPDGTYQPDRTINRAEFTKIVIESQFTRAQIDACRDVFFPDVPAGQWFTNYVCVAKKNTIIEGYPDGTFKPAQNISFVEAAKIIVVTFKYSVGTDAIWYKPFVEGLGEKRAIPTTIDRFEKNITRGEMAEMIYRLLAEITSKSSLTYSDLTGETAPTPTVTPPTSSVKEFNLTARQWEFIPSTITVQKGESVRLNIQSIDVTHGFAITAFGVSETLTPGNTVTVEFVADKAGTFSFFCTVFCGLGHSGMRGTLIVEETMSQPSAMQFQGTVLAGSTSPLLDFKQADYEAVLETDKPILLYFYANWCPLCKNEVRDATYPAFDAFDMDGLVGFRVNYNDSDTDADEVGLAREFGVAYQHTKVLLKNGDRILKSPEQWTKERYLQEMTDLLQ